MTAVYPAQRDTGSVGKRLLQAVAKASTLHVGAAATAAALRDDLTWDQRITEDQFNELFAVGRLTPGTTLLALQMLLGYSLAGWRLALAALTVGTMLPAAIIVVLVSVYVTYSSHPLVAHLMDGAQAGALAVFVWAAVRLAAPVIVRHRLRGGVAAVLLAIVVIADVLHPVVVLLIAAVVGGLFLQGQR